MPFLTSILRRNDAARTNLVSAIKSLISVLKEVEEYPALYLNQSVLREAIRRYEHVWIPLIAHTRPSERVALVPPLDVEWVWFCHMLCPVKYAIDSAAIWSVSRPEETGFLLDHKLFSGKARSIGKKKAKLAWEKRFPHEPFDIIASIRHASVLEDDITDQNGNDSTTPSSKITYDIALAASRQMAFYYQVGIMPQYSDDKFLRSAVDRYRKGYLMLQQKFPKEIWVPTFDIDLAWHAHIMHPRWYKEETVALRGSLLPHDDTMNDRSPNSQLSERWDATRARWFELFGESVTRDGGNWRGYVEGPERALRPAVVNVIKDVENQLKPFNGTLFSIQDGERNIGEDLEGTDWVHRTDRRRANHDKVGSSDSERVVERYTFLASDENRIPILMCRTSHFLVCNTEGKPYSFCTSVEVFDSIPHLHDKRTRYPLATAHHALPETICVGRQLEKKICSLIPGETALVLRAGGEDFALLCGKWRAFRPPRKSNTNVKPNRATGTNGVLSTPADPGDPGELSLRIWLLGNNSCGRWISLTRTGSRQEPGSFSFRLPYRDRSGVTVEDTVSLNLSDGTVRAGNVRNVIPGYLICMASSALHVALQPRFEPREGASPDSVETMYPARGVHQRSYAALRGAGGEVVTSGRNVGLSSMRFSMLISNRKPTTFFAASVSDIDNPNTAAVGCGCAECAPCEGPRADCVACRGGHADCVSR